jgi:hypothetical protein
MNIQITRIANGWILAIALPEGTVARYIDTDANLIKAITIALAGPPTVMPGPTKKG